MLTVTGLAELMAQFSPSDPSSIGPEPSAAVCMILQEGAAGLELLMIKRAEHESDPWSGHMAFPGGRVDPGDVDELDAALRECDEEIGVPASALRLVGRLSKMHATNRGQRINISVTPFVFSTTQSLQLQPNYEVADTVWIPLTFLSDPANRSSFERDFGTGVRQLHCYDYQHYRVWGMSLVFIDELMAFLAAHL